MITIEPDMVQFFNYVIAEGQVQVLHVMCYLQIVANYCLHMLLYLDDLSTTDAKDRVERRESGPSRRTPKHQFRTSGLNGN